MDIKKNIFCRNKIKRLIIVSFVEIMFLTGCSTTPLTKPFYSQRKLYVERNNTVAEDIKNAILAGKVIKGMSKEEALASWGKPTEIFQHTANDKEVWYYRGFGILVEPGKRVIFNNDTVETVYVSQN